ncbi:glycoside hydrolase family 15 protein [Synechococcus sp. PCC 7336]|uniref:glycoside hydrolase family 15 protein n=1 Tax=Synechococcus sp. PCC 7336 TaxID=195250 RepID=UPI000344DEFF|nr:glycoside hydrolase family 15 protein [Synechococcus sp. PCC 7336]
MSVPLQPHQQRSRLDFYYSQVRATILARQHPITGLLPASTAVNEHGDYTDAWVRDNVYSILAVWGLALAYRDTDDTNGRAYELEQSTVKLMRGLLAAMMKQAHKVEQFKHSQDPLDALHAKYDTSTGDVVVGDREWGHLQLDATSLFLLFLAQMTASGLRVIFTSDEVAFVQNLVFYIGKAYQTPDYGIWERGNKINHGKPELNASSVGMAKAALEAMNDFNLFGLNGGQASVVHVLAHDIARARVTLESLLPRESSSKEVDAATLSIIGYPAYAVEHRDLVETTRNKIRNQLEGRYGCKRFLRDGHQTAIEDTRRLHYEPSELKQFEHIECEWPLFFTYSLLDALCLGDRDRAEAYRSKLEALLVEKDGQQLLPELYFVPLDAIEDERAQPGSQQRYPNANLPLVWAQSLYLLGEMVAEGLLSVSDIDPLGRRNSLNSRAVPIVQLALLAEDKPLQAELAARGIDTQTLAEIVPIQVWSADRLAKAYMQVGRNDRLGLSGCPLQRMRSLATSRIFRLKGQPTLFLPAFLDRRQFYLTIDYHFLVATIRSELAYLQQHWRTLGRPTMVLMITRNLLRSGSTALLDLMQELQEGSCNGVTVQLGRIDQLKLTAGTERIDYLHDFELVSQPLAGEQVLPSYLRYDEAETHPLSSNQELLLECETDVEALLKRLRRSGNPYEQVEVLSTLLPLEGADCDTGFGRHHSLEVTIQDLLDELYNRAGRLQLWSVVRRAAGLLRKVDIGLADAVTDILVRQKVVAVGKAYTEASTISSPQSQEQIFAKILRFCSEDVREHVLTQEITIFLSLLVRSNPSLFDNLITLRVSNLILLITGEIAQAFELGQEDAYDRMMAMSPFEIKTHLKQVLEEYNQFDRAVVQQESLHIRTHRPDLQQVEVPDAQEPLPAGGWLRRRRMEGSLNRVPPDFYRRVWNLMGHCKGLAIGDKLERRNHLDSQLILAEMTPGEQNFARAIEHLLNKTAAPEYRQLNVEALMALSQAVEANPDLQIEDDLVMDVVIGHAVRLAWLEEHPEHRDRYRFDGGLRARAWSAFYERSPYHCEKAVIAALSFLIGIGLQERQSTVA